MAGATQVLALSFGELTLPIDCLDPQAEQRLRAQLRQGKARRKVTMVPAPKDDQDVEGHTFAGTLRSVLVHVRVGESADSMPVRVHFPTTQEADHFRRNLIVTGVLAGTLALGTVGMANLASNQAKQAATGSQSVESTVVQSAAPARVQVVLPEGNPYAGKAAVEESLGLQPSAAAADESALPGSRYSGKAAIGESLGMEQSTAPADEESALPGNPYSGKSSIGESLK